MIPSEVCDIADLIFAKWSDAEPEVQADVLQAAWRLYNAGYRKPDSVPAS